MIMMVRMPVIALLATSFATLAFPVQSELALGFEPLSDQELSEYRGGFLMDDLEISIGLEQIVGINGDTLVINRLTIPNLNQAANDRVVDHHAETVLEVISANRSGSTRVSSQMAGPNGWMTVVQNNLDSTVIQNMHQLNIELSNLGAGNQFPARFSDQLIQLLGR
ncbi:hypothetical protein [Marinobacter subterrani]|uniref:Uncharacterized protein n=1 Tax=Marinobacter subterrani TaxID=1658765 RepID=A0A0J7JF39_9GAMM|nr:hypothetical protein [Marinobacter subterrani]KMQ76519.1 hypothetical protein Msub_12733 [Marinobacter subterrani]